MSLQSASGCVVTALVLVPGLTLLVAVGLLAWWVTRQLLFLIGGG